MKCCSQAAAVSIAALAAAITEGKTPEEISFLASVFVQLGDTMAMIVSADQLCAARETKKKENCN